MERIILHIDMDAFYASVEQRDHPQWRGKPVIVGADPGRRGVVSAASYEARKFGIHSAMPISRAYAACPGGIYVRPRMHVYARVSEQIMNILESFSPQIEQISIDEAFLDISGTEKLWGEPKLVAKKITAEIQKQQNLTASIGIAPNKFLAKVASDLHKPQGITQAPFELKEIERWLAPLPVSRIWGIGVKTNQFFANYGVHTVADLQEMSLEYLEQLLGSGGRSLYYLARGIDSRQVGSDAAQKSISREHTFEHDTADLEQLKAVLIGLAADVARRARRQQVRGGTVVLKFRGKDFIKLSRQKTMPEPTSSTSEIYEAALELLKQKPLAGNPARLIGVGITNLTTTVQTSLFEKPEKEASENAVDKVMEKFGSSVIKRGRQVRRNG